ncbi:MAG: SIS domain-containing protein [Termitinemataceae bacterium]|nr:MAG: SIS domain-containing protein [Termitinemataceae bacterium]
MKYTEFVSTIIAENRSVLEKVELSQINRLLEEIEKAKTIQLYAMGRMQLSVRGFAMRLKHMGFDAYVVYDTITPAIGRGDLLIDICAVTNVELNVIRCAKDAGATIGLLTAHPENEHGKLSDFTVHVPGQIFGGATEVKSIQPMASLLEQSMFLFTDIVIMLLIERNKIDVQAMHKRHGNLEGIDSAFA